MGRKHPLEHHHHERKRSRLHFFAPFKPEELEAKIVEAQEKLSAEIAAKEKLEAKIVAKNTYITEKRSANDALAIDIRSLDIEIEQKKESWRAVCKDLDDRKQKIDSFSQALQAKLKEKYGPQFIPDPIEFPAIHSVNKDIATWREDRDEYISLYQGGYHCILLDAKHKPGKQDIIFFQSKESDKIFCRIQDSPKKPLLIDDHYSLAILKPKFKSKEAKGRETFTMEEQRELTRLMTKQGYIEGSYHDHLFEQYQQLETFRKINADAESSIKTAREELAELVKKL